MQEALQTAGWRDYSLFLREDGLLIGCVTTDDFERARRTMRGLEVNARWQAEMAPFFEENGVDPDLAMEPLEEVFHLD